MDVEVSASGYIKELQDIYGVEEEETCLEKSNDGTEADIESEVAQLARDFKIDLETSPDNEEPTVKDESIGDVREYSSNTQEQKPTEVDISHHQESAVSTERQDIVQAEQLQKLPHLNTRKSLDKEELTGKEEVIASRDSLGNVGEHFSTTHELAKVDVTHNQEPEACSDSKETDEVEQLQELEDWQSLRSRQRRGTSGSVSSMSTIHPDVIKSRVKKNFERRSNADALKRIRAKGEASAVTRKRRENKDLVRSDGIWGWNN